MAGNAIVRFFGRDDTEALGATVVEIEATRSKLLERIEGSEAVRRANAIEAAAGDKGARAALDAANATTDKVRSELADLDAALVEARQRLEDARAGEAEAVRQAKVAEVDRLFKERLALAETVEAALRQAAAALGGLDDLAVSIEPLLRELRPANNEHGQTIFYMRYFDPSRVGERLGEFLAPLGFDRWFTLSHGFVPTGESFVAAEKRIRDDAMATIAPASRRKAVATVPAAAGAD